MQPTGAVDEQTLDMALSGKAENKFVGDRTAELLCVEAVLVDQLWRWRSTMCQNVFVVAWHLRTREGITGLAGIYAQTPGG